MTQRDTAGLELLAEITALLIVIAAIIRIVVITIIVVGVAICLT